MHNDGLHMAEQSVKIIVLHGPDRKRSRILSFEKAEIRIGRLDSDDHHAAPDVAFESDPLVSRHHVRLARIKGVWYIVDLRSKSGTTVGGQEIRQLGSVRLTPGQPVTTGNTTWTIVPGDWAYVYDDPVLVTAPCVRTMNYATYHCGTPIVGPIKATNCGRLPSVAFCLRLVVEGFSDVYEVTVPALEPRQEIQLGIPAIPFRIEVLRRQVEPVQTRLKLEIAASIPVSTARNVQILGFWDWPYATRFRKVLAAFVSPRNPIVESIVLEAQIKAKESLGCDSFRALLRSGRPSAERLVLKSLYDYLATHAQLHFEEPNLVSSPMDLNTYQTIRLPHHIFADYTSSRLGKAKCLDLAMLLAGCLENVGLYPLIVLLGENQEIPQHAFVGCWVAPIPHGVPRVEHGTMRQALASGHLFVLECLGLVADVSRKKTKMSFLEACDSATRDLDQAVWAQGIDIASARPPYDSILPIDNPLEPEVDSAIEHARLFAHSKKLPCVETTHLLYGLLAAKSRVTQWLFVKMGLDSESILRQLDHLFECGQASQPPVPTENFVKCRRNAEEYALRSGSPSIQEHHLLWALLERTREKGSFYGHCRGLKIDANKLKKCLREKYPPPRSQGSGSIPIPWQEHSARLPDEAER